MAPLQAINQASKRKVLTPDERKQAFVLLLSMLQGTWLKQGSYGIVAEKFSVERKTVARLFNHLMKKLLITKSNELAENPSRLDLIYAANKLGEGFFATDRRGNCGRKKIWDLTMLADEIRALPQENKINERAMAAALGVPIIMINKLKQAGLIKRRSSKVKPLLTQKHLDDRLMWCLGMIEPTTITPTRSALKYQEMYDLVHIDEKWFNLKKTRMGFILCPDEELPYRTTKHKSHIQKVQFLAAIGRPHFVEETGEWFDGKIGMWPVWTLGHLC